MDNFPKLLFSIPFTLFHLNNDKVYSYNYKFVITFLCRLMPQFLSNYVSIFLAVINFDYLHVRSINSYSHFTYHHEILRTSREKSTSTELRIAIRFSLESTKQFFSQTLEISNIQSIIDLNTFNGVVLGYRIANITSFMIKDHELSAYDSISLIKAHFHHILRL